MMKNWRHYLLSLMLLSPCLAAEDYLNLSIEDLLDVSVTGSTLREESLETVPSAVTVFTRQQIDAMGVDYLHELVTLVPGFQVHRNADNGVGYSISARGRKQTTKSREILLIVDGRLLNNRRSGGADSAILMYPLASVERVEVIRGPSSAIYGSGAMMGVINIVSRTQQSDIRIALASHNGQQMDLQWGQSQGLFSSDLALHLYEDQGDAFTDGTTRFADPRREIHVDTKLSYDKTRLSFIHSSNTSMGFYTSEYLNDDFNRYQQIFNHLTLEQTWSPTEDWQMDLYVAQQATRNKVKVNLLPAGALAAVSQPASVDPFWSEARSNSREVHVKWSNDLTLSSRNSLQWGAELRKIKGSEGATRIYTNFDLMQLARNQFPVSSSSEMDFVTSIMDDFNSQLTSVYGQYLLGLNDKTRITLGLRHDDYRDLDSRTSPRLGVVYQANDTHTFKLLYGEAFRAPSLLELYTINNISLLGNPNLVSERINTWELIWQANWKPVTLGIDLYHNELINPIVNGFLPGGARTYLNGSRDRYQGGELRLDWQINSHWLAGASYSRTNNLPDSAFREADRVQQMTLQYQASHWSWNLMLVEQGPREYLVTTTERKTIDTDRMMNSRLRYQLTRHIDLDFTIKNLGDTDYRSAPQGRRIPEGIPHRGREWILGMNWDW